MTEACGTCGAYNPDLGRNKYGEVKMPGFGMCRHLQPYQYRSAWPWGCTFTPSRYEPADEKAPPRDPVPDMPATTGERAPLELT